MGVLNYGQNWSFYRFDCQSGCDNYFRDPCNTFTATPCVRQVQCDYHFRTVRATRPNCRLLGKDCNAALKLMLNMSRTPRPEFHAQLESSAQVKHTYLAVNCKVGFTRIRRDWRSALPVKRARALQGEGDTACSICPSGKFSTRLGRLFASIAPRKNLSTLVQFQHCTTAVRIARIALL